MGPSRRDPIPRLEDSLNHPTVGQWRGKVQLKKSGSEWSGPCPLCGGDDRFHVREVDGRALVGCRGCIDGLPAAARSRRYVEIVKSVFEDEPIPFRPITRKPRTSARDQRVLAKAIKKAQWIIDHSTTSTHQYLIRKGFPDHKSLTWEEKLVIPIRDWQGTLLSVQLIQEDGTKRFLRHTKVKGGRFVLGSGPERWVVEGFATGLSIKAALDSLYRRARVLVAFSAANILEVARRGDRIIADHDPGGQGEKYARKTGCRWWMPAQPGDACDVHCRDGLDILAGELRLFLNQKKKGGP